MPIVPAAHARRTETPNAVMTTLASPTQGDATHSLWRVEMRPGQAGPAHAFDAEQVWSVLSGGATLHLAGDRRDLAPGDTAVLPPGVPRRIVADPEAGLTAIVAGAPGARASMADGTDRGVPPWIA